VNIRPLNAALAACALPLAFSQAQDPQPATAEKPNSAEKPAPGASAPEPPAIPPIAAAAHNHVRLSKAALDREFLLSASVIPQLVAPTSTALAGKIVRFEVFHDGVDLYESTDGMVVTKELPARRLLTTFPIVGQDDKTVTIDFNAGMRRVFNDIWYAAKAPGEHAALSQARSLEIPQGRVFEVREEAGILTIRQSAQVRDRQMDPNKEDRYEIRYFIAPYSPGDFQTKEHAPGVSRYVRFFELHPQIEPNTGRTSSRISLFDIRKPVVIHYSANTPAEYESAVRDGILYWNRAFGREVLKAEKAPEGVTAPNARLNLIQWVPWDSAGFAYADIIIDPRSGSAQRGQTYLTSTFAINGRSRARALLRNLRTTAAEPKPTAPKPSLDGTTIQPTAATDTPLFANARACQSDPAEFAESFATGLEAALADPRLNDAAVKRLAGDYLREVVAHEVGHMLGLRHNFAGSLSSTLSHKELSDWFKSYIADDQTKLHADRIPSSSVMDYIELRASVYAGWKIRKTTEVLPYDLAAIRWGYSNSNEVADKHMLFATDQDIEKYGDVDRFDSGVEPVVSAYASIGEELKNLPNSLIEQFIAAKAPRDPRDKRPLDQLNLDPERTLTRLSDSYGKLLSWFRADRRSARLEQHFPFVGPLNQKELHRKHLASLNEQIDKLGGVDRALFSYLPVELKLESKGDPAGVSPVEKIDAKKLTDRLSQLLESPEYTNFTGLDEQPASFSKEDKELIVRRGRAFFQEIEKGVLKRFCQKLELARRDLGVQALEEVSEEDVVAKLERRIIDLARELILTRSEEHRHKGKVDKATVEVTDFRFNLEARSAAAKMLSDQSGSFRNWCAEPRTDIAKQLKDNVDASLNIQNFREFRESTLSRTLRDWYLNQQTILGLLNFRAAPPMPAPTQPRPTGH
jgi:hypothetical protein